MNPLALAFLLIALGPTAAGASQQGVVAGLKWKAMDRCAAQAHAAFPDFTAEANARREAKLKACLAGQNLPPRQPLAPPR